MSLSKRSVVQVLQTFKPVETTCMEIKKGEYIIVYKRDSSGWWYGVSNGRSGWFPSNFSVPASDKMAEEVMKREKTVPPSSFKVGARGPGSHETGDDQVVVEEDANIGRRANFPLRVATSHPPDMKQDAPHTFDFASPSRVFAVPPSLLDSVMLPLNVLFSLSAGSEEKQTALKNLLKGTRNLFLYCGVLAEDAPLLLKHEALAQARQEVFANLKSVISYGKEALADEPPNGANIRLQMQVDFMRKTLEGFMDKMTRIPHRFIPSESEHLVLASRSRYGTSHLTDASPILNDKETEIAALLHDHEYQVRIAVSQVQQHLSAATLDMSTLLPVIRETLNKVGQFLSMVEEFHLPAMNDALGDAIEKDANSSSLLQFNSCKETLYTHLNDLLNTVRTGAMHMQPTQAAQSISRVVKSVQQASHELGIACRRLLPLLKNYEEHTSNEAHTEMTLLSPRTPMTAPVSPFFPPNTPRHGALLTPATPYTPSTLFSEMTLDVSSADLPSPKTPKSPGFSFMSPKAPRAASISPRLAPKEIKKQKSFDILRLRKQSEPAIQPVQPTPRALVHKPKYAPLPFSSKFTAYSARSVLAGTTGSAPLEMRTARRQLSDEGDDKTLTIPTIRGSNKVMKFFGIDSSRASEVRQEDKTPWFLKRDYKPGEVTFNMENQISGGTWEALIEMLTLHEDPTDNDYMEIFLTTFRNYATPLQLMETLQGRYMLRPPNGLTPDQLEQWKDKKLVPIRYRVFKTFKAWLEHYFYDGVDDVIIDPLRTFISTDMTPTMETHAKRLMESVDKRVAGISQHSSKPQQRLLSPSAYTTHFDERESAPVEIIPPPLASKQLLSNLRNRSLIVDMLDIDAQELARQLTLMDMNLYCMVKPYELIGQEWLRKTSTVAVNIRTLTALSVQVTTWAAECVLFESDVKKRAANLRYVIKVAEKCMQLNNLDMLFSILAAVNASPIERLWNTWELVPNRVKITLSELRKISDHKRNYTNYRSYLRSLHKPCLPFVGLFLTDLVFTDDGNPKYRQPLAVFQKRDLAADIKIINFDKHVKTMRIIQDLQSYQKKPYALQNVPEIQDWIRERFQQLHSNGDPAMMYEQSLIIEPKVVFSDMHDKG